MARETLARRRGEEEKRKRKAPPRHAGEERRGKAPPCHSSDPREFRRSPGKEEVRGKKGVFFFSMCSIPGYALRRGKN